MGFLLKEYAEKKCDLAKCSAHVLHLLTMQNRTSSLEKENAQTEVFGRIQIC